jgi:hypothetical protein
MHRSQCGNNNSVCQELGASGSQDRFHSCDYQSDQQTAINCTGNNSATVDVFQDVLRFDLFPAELQAEIIESLGSEFFCEDVRRLAISHGWFHWALRTMYYDMTFSKASHPLAPSALTGNFTDSECTGKMTDSLEKHLRIVRINLDQMYRGYQFLPEDADLRQYKKKPALLERREMANLQAERDPRNMESSPEPTTIQSMLIMSCNLIYQAFASTKAHTLDFHIKEAWGFYRGQISGFEAVLCETLVKKQLAHLYLDLAGLARRKEPRHKRIGERAAELADPLPLRHITTYNEIDPRDDASDMPEPWADGHVCNSIMQALPHLETLHYRSRCICPGIFRWQYPEAIEQWREMWPSYEGWPGGASHAQSLKECRAKADSPLPKLKDVIINMVLPRENLKHKRVVHCMTFDSKLTREAENHYADYAVKEMKREISRLVKRLENPRLVRLRYSRMSGEKLDRHFIDEFDALTGKTRQRAIDRWGEAVDSDE